MINLLVILLVGLLLPLVAVAQRPNVILIFADDIGFGDLECYGHPYSETPNLCRLAREGTRFENFYVTGNVCPHSRSGLLTSRNPSWFPNYTPDYGFRGTETIYNLLDDAGYHTGHIGKWNIGIDPDNEHKEYGIDYYRGTGSQSEDPFGREGKRFSIAIDFLENNAREPFYLNMWIYATHTPIKPSEQFLDRYRNLDIDYSKFGGSLDGVSEDRIRKYLADLWSLDLNVGRLLDKLDELGIADNTLIAFTSDNGPEEGWGGYAGGLRDGKHSYYEGGVRVPFLVRYPGHVPAGKVNSQSIISSLDWLPTICTFAGCQIPWDKVEGEDLTDVLEGSNRSRQKPVMWRGICEGSNNPGCFNRLYMRYGKWKLHEIGRNRALYDLSVDPSERNNVYSKNPDVVEVLLQSLYDWDSTLPSGNARLPSSPLPFDPNEDAPDIMIPELEGGGGSSPTLRPPAPRPPTQSPPTSPTPPFSDSCQTFTIPFQASALAYCGFSDTSDLQEGNCGSGPVDSLKLESNENKNLCQSDCFVSHVKAGEHVDYSFTTTTDNQNVEISAIVASLSPKRFEMELVEASLSSGARRAPGKGYRVFEKETWTVMVPKRGSNTLRVTFLDEHMNLCSVGIRPSGNSPPSSGGDDTSAVSDFVDNGPDCETFSVPFQASALSYCNFADSSAIHRGNCGSGPVDAKASTTCSCHIAFVQPGEYLDYYFTTDRDNQDVIVTVNVAGIRPGRQMELKLLNDDSKIGRVSTPSNGYEEFEPRTWRTTVASSGLNGIRITFLDPNTNFCTMEINLE